VKVDMIRLVVLLVVAMVPGTVRGDSDRPLLATGADEHVWLVVPSEQDSERWDLCHGTRRSGSFSYRVVRRLAEQPIALGAWGSTVWILLSSPHADGQTFDAYQLRAVYQASLDLDLIEPREGFGPLPPLKGFDSIDLLAGTSTGPLVIGSLDDRPVARRLVSGQWVEVELPVPERSWSGIHAAGCCGFGSFVIAFQCGEVVECWRASETGGWMRLGDAIDGISEGLVAVDGLPVLATRRGPDGLAFDYVQTGSSAELTIIDRPEGPWALMGLTGSIFVLSLADDQLVAEVVDAPGGTLHRLDINPPVGIAASSIWSIAVAIGLVSMVVMIIVLARGGDLASSSLPTGYIPMSPLARLAALGIDLVPGLLAFYLLFGGATRDLVRVPMMSLGSDEVTAYALLVLVTIIWCLCWETGTGASLGKWACGGQVRTTDGNRPGFRQLFVRNLVKGLVLLVPPLAVLTLLHPNQQGLGDLLARTVVVRPVAPPLDEV
tara:strand:- start:10687 stop:12162 length:1476 start_codon:yes stop_codon:yes gene_type:complete